MNHKALCELLDALLHGSIMSIEEEAHFFERAKDLGIDRATTEELLERTLRERKILREKTLKEQIDALIAPRVRDYFLDLDEERQTIRTIREKWNIDPIRALALLRESVQRHGAKRAEDLREEFEGYLFSRLEEDHNVPRHAVDYLLQIARQRGIQDEAGVEALIDNICEQQGWIRADATGTFNQINSGSHSVTQSKSERVIRQNTGSFMAHSNISEEQIRASRQIIMARIGNDGYLDQKEENEYFAKVGDELGILYEDALKILEQTLAQYDAVRERTAVDTFRKRLTPMLEDQYLDSAELQRAHKIARELGLDRSEDINLINKLISDELDKAGALTEDKARERLHSFLLNPTHKKHFTPDELRRGVEALLKEYRLAHKAETFQQVEMLANEIAESNGIHITHRSKMPKFILAISTTVFMIILGGGALWWWMNDFVNTPRKTSPPKHTSAQILPSKHVLTPTVQSCEISASIQSQMDAWLRQANRAYENNRLMTPVEDCVNLWTRRIIDKVRDLCPNFDPDLHSTARTAKQFRLKARDFYIQQGQRAIKQGNKKSACNTWFPRADAFGGGEILEDLIDTHCNTQKKKR